MPSNSSKSNSVVQAVETACALFGVRCYRMNSRVFTVTGAGGRERPMFVGGWTDRFGAKYRKGMADLLLTPHLRLPDGDHGTWKVAVTLWVECKSGAGRLTEEQKAFRDDVIEAGAFYLEVHDSADAVIEWFEKHGVKR